MDQALVEKKAKSGFILGIVSAGLAVIGWFTFALLFCNASLVTSIIGTVKSAKGLKAEGKRKTQATVGLVLSIVFIVISIVMLGLVWSNIIIQVIEQLEQLQ